MFHERTVMAFKQCSKAGRWSDGAGNEMHTSR